MKTSFLILSACIFCGTAGFAQIYDSVSNPETDYTHLLTLYRKWQKTTQTVDGYRIQLSSSDDRAVAYDKKARLYRQFPHLKSYVTYDQPYFRLRIGDFPDRLTATRYLMKVILIYPEAFIVRDNIRLY